MICVLIIDRPIPVPQKRLRNSIVVSSIAIKLQFLLIIFDHQPSSGSSGNQSSSKGKAYLKNKNDKARAFTVVFTRILGGSFVNHLYFFNWLNSQLFLPFLPSFQHKKKTQKKMETVNLSHDGSMRLVYLLHIYRENQPNLYRSYGVWKRR